MDTTWLFIRRIMPASTHRKTPFRSLPYLRLRRGGVWGGDVDAPALGLDFEDAADDEIADFGNVAEAQGADGEELVGFGDRAGERGDDGLGAVARGGETREGSRGDIPHPLGVVSNELAWCDDAAGVSAVLLRRDAAVHCYVAVIIDIESDAALVVVVVIASVHERRRRDYLYRHFGGCVEDVESNEQGSLAGRTKLSFECRMRMPHRVDPLRQQPPFLAGLLFLPLQLCIGVVIKPSDAVDRRLIRALEIHHLPLRDLCRQIDLERVSIHGTSKHRRNSNAMTLKDHLPHVHIHSAQDHSQYAGQTSQSSTGQDVERAASRSPEPSQSSGSKGSKTNFLRRILSSGSKSSDEEEEVATTSTEPELPLREPDIVVELPPAADFHVHLRDGEMMETVTPTIEKGGVNLVYVMPNLVPPITDPETAISYMSKLQRLSPNTTFLPTLYLHQSITPTTIEQAAKLGIVGVKSYPRGLTTNSDSGVLSYDLFYPVFQAMSDHGLVLNIHGECPSTPPEDVVGSEEDDITILNAEAKFLPTLLSIHSAFPKLRIVLEHCTTAAAVEAVQACGPTVAGTITAHHLFLTIDNWADDPYCFCKPVAKLPADRAALIAAATSGDPKFFLGTDSAPHPRIAKQGRSGNNKTVAGVFTQPYAVQLVAEAFDKVGKADKETLEGFCCRYGREFYQVTQKGLEVAGKDKRRIVLMKGAGERVVKEFGSGDGAVVPFRAGEEVWTLQWKE
ncbi:Dihydroorotase [Drechslerella dactyloides]|uniref:dihydroorotase n=1 Tax=Drechslerella dactyloides TaxID=74499 RepID=A0AAD6IRY9_DREDA|nr:Dihydroorotase [Drechslerella dactyloides]